MSVVAIKDISARLASRPDLRTAVVSGKTFVPLLALLEHSLQDVESRFQSCLIEAGFSHEESAAITTQRVAFYALTAELGMHWRERAISWLENGLAIDEALIDVLRAMAKDSLVPQSLRHRAIRLSKTKMGEA